MKEGFKSNLIKFSCLQELQQIFQKEIEELIEIYVIDMRRKIANLHTALNDQNLSNFKVAARELRQRSVEIGAINFSYTCLTLEIAAQELRLESLPKLLQSVQTQFSQIHQALEQFKEMEMSV